MTTTSALVGDVRDKTMVEIVGNSKSAMSGMAGMAE
jgi:hypothetical protein